MNHRVVLLALCVGLLLVGTASAWYDTDWDYRKSFTLNNTGSNLTDYQVMFTVNRSAGSDSGFTVYLDSKCEEDYDDIRFVGDDDTTVWDHWVESNSSTVATIWVEVPSIPNSTVYGSTMGYLYYGNSGASAASNGTNTFQFFDDFPGDSLDTSVKWNSAAYSGGSGRVSVSDGICTVIHTSGWGWWIYTKSNFGANTAFKTHSNITSVAQYATIGYQSATNYAVAYQANYPTANQINIMNRNPYPTETASPIGDTYTGYRFLEAIRNGTTSSIFNIGGANVGTLSTNVPTVDIPIGFIAQVQNIYIDWVFVRKYTSIEPTISSWGSEVAGIPITIEIYFSGAPLSGYVPLMVYFLDESIGNNCTVDTWQWSFGDSTPNSTQQNPAHTYTTSGLFNVGLTVSNTTYSKINATTKTGYINVTVNVDAPTADFTVTETCGDIGETFYFIDFSTGGGLYAWNWSFGDGAYSELRNPTHQYASNGTYDVNLTVWGAYGVDSLLRSNLITIPCGAPTPTPTATVTVTPTGTPGNVTEGNITYIYAPDQDYVPFPIWLAIVIVSIALFGHSIIFLRNSDLTAMMAAVFAFISAWLSNMIGYIDVQVTYIAEEILISPVIQAVHPPWLVYTMLLFALVSVVNIFAAIYKVYLKPTPWNEIYNRKLPKWRNR